MGLLVCAELFLNTDIILPDISVHKLDEFRVLFNYVLKISHLKTPQTIKILHIDHTGFQIHSALRQIS